MIVEQIAEALKRIEHAFDNIQIGDDDDTAHWDNFFAGQHMEKQRIVRKAVVKPMYDTTSVTNARRCDETTEKSLE